jgi:hypothetical protein
MFTGYTRAYSLGLKQLGHEANYSSASSAEVKISRAVSPLLYSFIVCNGEALLFKRKYNHP